MWNTLGCASSAFLLVLALSGPAVSDTYPAIGLDGDIAFPLWQSFRQARPPKIGRCLIPPKDLRLVEPPRGLRVHYAVHNEPYFDAQSPDDYLSYDAPRALWSILRDIGLTNHHFLVPNFVDSEERGPKELPALGFEDWFRSDTVIIALQITNDFGAVGPSSLQPNLNELGKGELTNEDTGQRWLERNCGSHVVDRVRFQSSRTFIMRVRSPLVAHRQALLYSLSSVVSERAGNFAQSSLELSDFTPERADHQVGLPKPSFWTLAFAYGPVEIQRLDVSGSNDVSAIVAGKLQIQGGGVGITPTSANSAEELIRYVFDPQLWEAVKAWRPAPAYVRLRSIRDFVPETIIPEPEVRYDSFGRPAAAFSMIDHLIALRAHASTISNELTPDQNYPSLLKTLLAGQLYRMNEVSKLSMAKFVGELDDSLRGLHVKLLEDDPADDEYAATVTRDVVTVYRAFSGKLPLYLPRNLLDRVVPIPYGEAPVTPRPNAHSRGYLWTGSCDQIRDTPPETVRGQAHGFAPPSWLRVTSDNTVPFISPSDQAALFRRLIALDDEALELIDKQEIWNLLGVHLSTRSDVLLTFSLDVPVPASIPVQVQYKDADGEVKNSIAVPVLYGEGLEYKERNTNEYLSSRLELGKNPLLSPIYYMHYLSNYGSYLASMESNQYIDYYNQFQAALSDYLGSNRDIASRADEFGSEEFSHSQFIVALNCIKLIDILEDFVGILEIDRVDDVNLERQSHESTPDGQNGPVDFGSDLNGLLLSEAFRPLVGEGAEEAVTRMVVEVGGSGVAVPLFWNVYITGMTNQEDRLKRAGWDPLPDGVTAELRRIGIEKLLQAEPSAFKAFRRLDEKLLQRLLFGHTPLGGDGSMPSASPPAIGGFGGP